MGSVIRWESIVEIPDDWWTIPRSESSKKIRCQYNVWTSSFPATR